MYYKLPIKERFKLMKDYREAYPEFSYSQMVNHFNDNQMADGGKLGEDDLSLKQVAPQKPFSMVKEQPKTFNNFPSTSVAQRDKTNVVTNTPQGQEYAFTRYQDSKKLDDEVFRNKYNTSIHRYNYDNDPKYRAEVERSAKITGDKYGTVKEKIDLDPNSMFMLPNRSVTLEGAKQAQDFNKEVIGFALPIPGLQQVGKLPSVGKVVGDLGKYLTEETALRNANKLNPYSFKPNPEAFYRQIDNETFKEGVEGGLIRGKQNINTSAKINEINLNKAFGDDAYYNKGSLYYKYNKDLPYLFEANLPEESFIPKVNGRTRKYTRENTSVRVSKEPIAINDPNITIYQKDWLKGYKQVELPKTNFQSEIDWAKWNKEIPDNKVLMQEYNAIEQQAKADGTWMKNPDGSNFNGTPEQFIQQNSKNFKKAYSEGFENVYRGTGENIPELRPNRSIFTANQELASGYAPFNKKSNFLNSESTEGGLYSFYRKNSKNSLELDANNTSWTGVDLSNKRLTKEYFEKNIKFQEEQLLKRKHDLSKLKQLPNGSWTDGADYVISNDLYKNWIPEQELYLRDLKERYKNIDNLISNPKELEEMKKVLGNKTTTDDIAAYIEKRNLDYVKLKNIEDSGVGDVTIVNHKPGNYLKSAIGNNGMFDMTNPNIYKAAIPGILGAGIFNKNN